MIAVSKLLYSKLRPVFRFLLPKPLKKSYHPLLTYRDPMSHYRFIAAEQGHYPVRRLC